MGLFGGFCNFVKSCASKVAETVKKGASYVKEKVTNAWNSLRARKLSKKQKNCIKE
jgi:hypothetical protein